MKRKLPVIECDICTAQQVDNGDPTEVLGVTIKAAFFAGYAGGGPVPKDTFICLDCIDGNDDHGPVLMSVLLTLVFDGEVLLSEAYARKEKS